MKTILFRSLFFGFTLTLIFSCGSDSDEGQEQEVLSNQKQITSFTISGINGIINNADNTITITITGPDQDLASLISVAPVISIPPGATITPASGTQQDFTNPVMYTVTAEDGTTNDFIVTVVGTAFSFTFDGRTYEIVSEELSWRDAAAFAVERGGFLAEINSNEENTAIFSVLVNNPEMEFRPSGRQAVWLGGNDFENEGTWILDGDNDGNGSQFWEGEADGMPVDELYNNWGATEPDNFALNAGQNALSMALDDPALPAIRAGQWCDVEEEVTLFFVIEFN